MDTDFFVHASLWVLKLGCFISITIIVVKKILSDLRGPSHSTTQRRVTEQLDHEQMDYRNDS